jgi:hypothetical protein
MDVFTGLTLPRRPRGRLSAAAEEAYKAERSAFCKAILEIQSTLDFTPSARGWGYILENAKAITKDELDACENLINECRKSGELPLEICSADETRAFENLERIDKTTPEQEAHCDPSGPHGAPGRNRQRRCVHGQPGGELCHRSQSGCRRLFYAAHLALMQRSAHSPP